MPTVPKSTRPHWTPPPRKAWEHGNRWDGYNTRTWRDARAAILIACDYQCSTPGCTRPASTLDHDKPVSSGHDPWDRSNWKPLCRVCHKVKSSKEGAAARAGRGTTEGGV